MQKTVIIYSTTDGQTKRICEQLVRQIESQTSVKLCSINEATKIDLESCEKIIIGASIRYGKHSKELYKFIELNKNILNLLT